MVAEITKPMGKPSGVWKVKEAWEKAEEEGYEFDEFREMMESALGEDKN